MRKIIKLTLSACLISFAFSVYNVGQTVTTSDQNEVFSVCYGEFESNTLSLSDFNGSLNGGSYKVIHIDMSASW